MKDKTTIITNPENGDTKTFSYDHSYWSHDNYRETTSGIYEADSPDSPYIDQVCQSFSKTMDIPSSFDSDGHSSVFKGRIVCEFGVNI